MAAPATPRPSLIRPRSQLGAGGLASDHSAAATASSRRRRDFVFVVNPSGANGRTGKQWKQLLPHLRSRLADQCNICECVTSGPFHAIDVTREAIKDGADAVIAVGGDGTLHEVVNGFFWKGSPVRALDRGPDHLTTLGLIPLGTGSDFARTFGWSNDPRQAIDRIVRGVKSKLDIGMMEGPNGDPHFFVNVADIHLSAKAGYFASMYKRFGNLCYVLGALRGFWGHNNRDLRIKVNEGDWTTVDKATALCIGNAKFFGGGMKITPTADPFSGDLEVVILQNFKWYDFLLKLHRLYAGTHLPVNGVSSMSDSVNLNDAPFIKFYLHGKHSRDTTQSMLLLGSQGRVQSIEVAEVVANGDIFVQSDGEHFGFLPTKFSVLPGAVDFFC